ncbi:hypothetical protein [Cupriavidus campinensis]
MQDTQRAAADRCRPRLPACLGRLAGRLAGHSAGHLATPPHQA